MKYANLTARIKGLLSLLLCLLLLAGCGTDTGTSSQESASTQGQQDAAPSQPQTPQIPAPPEQTTEERQTEFLTFLETVNDQRRAIYETSQQPMLDESWTPDLTKMDSDFTQEEMDAFLTQREAVTVSAQEAREDVEAAFRLLRHSYGPYDYFGGDAVFSPLCEEALAALPQEGDVTPEELEDILAGVLAPVLADGHFTVGGTSLVKSRARYLYFVPDLYFDDDEGLDPELVKPTIDGDGRIRLCLAVLATAEEAESLPDTLTIQGVPVSVEWKRDTWSTAPGNDVFTETTFSDGTPLLTCTAMWANTTFQKKQLERLASCGGDYADGPVLVLDVRGNGGGSDHYINQWFQGYTGQSPSRRLAWGLKLSALNRRCYTVNANQFPVPETSQWTNLSCTPGQFVQHQGLTLVLQNKGTASSGETAVQNLRTLENTLFIGANTLGCSLTPNNFHFYLPHSGLSLYFGTGLLLIEDGTNVDGTGFLPDLWVPTSLSADRAERLVAYYGLSELFAQ